MRKFMKMFSVFSALCAIAALGTGCAQLQALQGVYHTVTTATVPAGDAVIAANAFDALKATAVNYGKSCLAQKKATGAWPQPVCSDGNRRIVVKAVRAGTAARVQLEASVTTGQPAVGTVYNALIAAVSSLQSAPITNSVTP